MSSFLTNNYTFPIDSSLSFKEEFSFYLKNIFQSVVTINLNILRQNEDFDETYTFSALWLPSDTIKGKKDSNVSFISSLPQEDLPEGLEEEKELISRLESLSPEDPEGFEFTLTLDEIVNSVISYLRIFSVVMFGNRTWYFGIPFDAWYPNIPIKIEDIMKVVDFGSPEKEPLNLFYPIFFNMRQNLQFYYDSFLNERSENIDNN